MLQTIDAEKELEEDLKEQEMENYCSGWDNFVSKSEDEPEVKLSREKLADKLYCLFKDTGDKKYFYGWLKVMRLNDGDECWIKTYAKMQEKNEKEKSKEQYGYLFLSENF